MTFDTAGGTGSGVCGIDLVFRIISNRVGGVRWCVKQSKARRDFDHDIALVNADAELGAIVTRRSDILLGHAALPFGRATQCIGNTGEFDQQAITGCFDDAAPVCVFQAFTSAAVALANGAPKIVMVRTVKEALELRQAGIGEICLGEVYGRAPMALISATRLSRFPASISAARPSSSERVQVRKASSRRQRPNGFMRPR